MVCDRLMMYGVVISSACELFLFPYCEWLSVGTSKWNFLNWFVVCADSILSCSELDCLFLGTSSWQLFSWRYGSVDCFWNHLLGPVMLVTLYFLYTESKFKSGIVLAVKLCRNL